MRNGGPWVSVLGKILLEGQGNGESGNRGCPGVCTGVCMGCQVRISSRRGAFQCATTTPYTCPSTDRVQCRNPRVDRGRPYVSLFLPICHHYLEFIYFRNDNPIEINNLTANLETKGNTRIKKTVAAAPILLLKIKTQKTPRRLISRKKMPVINLTYFRFIHSLATKYYSGTLKASSYRL